MQWKNSTVHAGDDIECKVTFRNICSSIDSQQSAIHLSSPALGRDDWTEPSPISVGQTLPRKPPNHKIKNLRTKEGSHRSTCFYDTPLSLRQASDYNAPSTFSHTSQEKTQKTHKRSISIVSIGNEGLPLDKSLASFAPMITKRPVRSHGRALSFQALPRAKFPSVNSVSGKQLRPFNPLSQNL